MIYAIFMVIGLFFGLVGFFGAFALLIGLINQESTLFLQGLGLTVASLLAIKIQDFIYSSIQDNNNTQQKEEQNDLVLTSNVKGVSHKNKDGSSRQLILEGLQHNSRLALIHETNNKHDSNAIVVKSSQGVVGFLPKELSEALNRLGFEYDTASLISKGKASNGMLGCTIRFHSRQTKSEKTGFSEPPSNFNSYRSGKPRILSESSYYALEDSRVPIDINTLEYLSEASQKAVTQHIEDYAKTRHQRRQKNLNLAIEETRHIKTEIEMLDESTNELNQDLVNAIKNNPEQIKDIKEKIKTSYFSKKDLKEKSLPKAYKELEETKKKIEKELETERSLKESHTKELIKKEFEDYKNYLASCKTADRLEANDVKTAEKSTNQRLWITLRSFEARNSNYSRRKMRTSDDWLLLNDMSDLDAAKDFDLEWREELKREIDTESDYGYGEDLNWDEFR